MRKRVISASSVALILLLVISSCKKKGEVPTLTTAEITQITETSATSGGTIASEGTSPVIARGVCWNESTEPLITDNKTSDATSVDSFTSLITGVEGGKTYYVRAYATNSEGTGYGMTKSFTTLEPPFTLTDIDGNIYQTVNIGTQTWLDANLKVTKFNNGYPIMLVTDPISWSSLTSWGFCWYDNNEATYKETYGALYNWYVVSTGIVCPIGWHVPSDTEWTTLTDFLGGLSVAGGKLKNIGTDYWDSPNTGATNESQFSAMPAGYRTFDTDGKFFSLHLGGTFWSSTPSNNAASRAFAVINTSESVIVVDNDNRYGTSIRCIKD